VAHDDSSPIKEGKSKEDRPVLTNCLLDLEARVARFPVTIYRRFMSIKANV